MTDQAAQDAVADKPLKPKAPWEVFWQSVQDWQMPEQRDRPAHPDSFLEAQKFFDLIPAGQILQITQGINVFDKNGEGMRHAHVHFFTNVVDENNEKRPVYGMYDDEMKLPNAKLLQEAYTSMSSIRFRTSRMIETYDNVNSWYFDRKEQDLRPVIGAMLIDPDTGKKQHLDVQSLIEKTDIGAALDEKHSSVLLEAGVIRNDLSIVKKAENLGAGFDVFGNYEIKYLEAAIRSSSHHTFDYVLNHGDFYKSEITDKHVRIAARAGDLEIFRKIQDASPMSMMGVSPDKGQNALMVAAEAGNDKIVHFLLDQGKIAPAARDWNNQDCLSLAAAAGKTEMIDIVTERTGIDPEAALYQAIKKGNVPVLEKILAHPDVDLNKQKSINTDQGALGTTPLVYAAEMGNPVIFDVLYRDPRTKPELAISADGANPLIAACSGNEPGHLDIARMIMDDPARRIAFDGRMQGGKTALEGAMATAKSDIFQKLLEDPSVDPNQGNSFGVPHLGEAVNRKSLSMVGALLDCPRTNPNITDRDGLPVLSYAVHHEETAIVERFLQHPKTDPALPAPAGKAPLELAKTDDMRMVLEQKIARNQTVQPLELWRQKDGKPGFTYYGKKYALNLDK